VKSVSEKLWHMSQTMRPHPISLRERVLSASGAAGRRGQDQLRNRQFGCWTLGMDRSLSQESSGHQYVSECCESVGEIKTIAPGLEQGLTPCSTKFERHILALRITTAPRERSTPKPSYWHQKVFPGESGCLTHVPRLFIMPTPRTLINSLIPQEASCSSST
jgi:hypothetical protein